MKRKVGCCIIGNGYGGIECLKALRANGYDQSIEILTNNAYDPYNPMLTTYYAVGKIPFSAMFPYGTNEALSKKYDAVITKGFTVAKLDAENKTVYGMNEDEVVYDACLMASGATPVVPPFQGADSPRVLTVRTVDDAKRLYETARSNPKAVVVIGASMVGVKLCELYYKFGAKVYLVDMAPRIMPLATHPDSAALLQERLKRDGVELMFEAAVTGFEDLGDGIKVHFKDGTEIRADYAAVCVGVRPNIAYTDPDQVAQNRGIEVNSKMLTSAPDLYAAGDIAKGTNLLTGASQIIGLLAIAKKEGAVAGRNIAGKVSHYTGSVPHNMTHFMGLEFASAGDVNQYDRMMSRKIDGGFVQMFKTGEKITGVNLISEGGKAGVLKSILLKNLASDSGELFRENFMIRDASIRSLIEEFEKL